MTPDQRTVETLFDLVQRARETLEEAKVQTAHAFHAIDLPREPFNDPFNNPEDARQRRIIIAAEAYQAQLLAELTYTRLEALARPGNFGDPKTEHDLDLKTLWKQKLQEETPK